MNYISDSGQVGVQKFIYKARLVYCVVINYGQKKYRILEHNVLNLIEHLTHPPIKNCITLSKSTKLSREVTNQILKDICEAFVFIRKIRHPDIINLQRCFNLEYRTT